MKILFPLFLFSTLLAVTPFGERGEGEFRGRVFTPQEDVLKRRFNYLYQFSKIASFISNWQVVDTADTNYGGVIEAEGGKFRDVIQTDNTQEAIWVWSRYGELTMDTGRFKSNIKRAWEYCRRYPAWEEEGLPHQYYRVHNCAWGLAAEEIYRRVYKDSSYLWYRDSCADYILKHPLNISHPNKGWRLINSFVQGWASGWLYKYGKLNSKKVYVDSSLAYGERLLNWIEENPDTNLTSERWAMSSGTVVWGICNSIFKEDTSRGREWIDDYGALVDTFQEWYRIPLDYCWDNSWNVAYANAHYAMYEISHKEDYKRHHLFLTNLLLSYDTDGDGAIPASTQDSDTEDMTWISAYLGLMGLDKLIGEPDSFDAGVLAFISLRDSMEVYVGESLRLGGVVTNFGLSPLKGVRVYIEGDYEDSTSLDMGFLETDTVIFKDGWIIDNPGWYHFTLKTLYIGDENFVNDTLSVSIYARPTGLAESFCYKSRSLLTRERVLRYYLPTPSEVEVKIYDVGGRVIWRRYYPKVLKGTHTIRLDQKISSGVYFLLLRANRYTQILKFIITH